MRISGALIGILLLVAATARADEVAEAEQHHQQGADHHELREAGLHQQAKQHYQRGADHYEHGRYAEAVKEFEEAYRKAKLPAILYNLARAETKLAHEEKAIGYLNRYLAEAPDSQDAPSVRAEIEARERRMEEPNRRPMRSARRTRRRGRRASRRARGGQAGSRSPSVRAGSSSGCRSTAWRRSSRGW